MPKESRSGRYPEWVLVQLTPNQRAVIEREAEEERRSLSFIARERMFPEGEHESPPSAD